MGTLHRKGSMNCEAPCGAQCIMYMKCEVPSGAQCIMYMKCEVH